LPKRAEIDTIFFVVMEFMSTRLSRISLSLLVGTGLVGATPFCCADLVLQKVSFTVAQSPNNLDVSTVALPADDQTAGGYQLASGTTTLIISLSKIESLDNVAFLNRGTKGEINVSISNTKLSANSPRWRQIAQQSLADQKVKAVVGPNEAKYVKLTFKVSEPGSISSLGVYAPPTLAANTSLSSALVESDGKTVQDGKDAKDLGESKDIPAEEAPAEGPPPGLPDPPPFTFVPQIVPTSP
jgi:hypothetical protein